MTLSSASTGQPEPLSVLVVGGGIGGLAAAIALRQNGHHVSVLDKSGLDNDSGAAIHLCPNASGILRQWGVYAETFGACLMSRYIQLTHDGHVLEDLDLTGYNARWPHPWHLVHRASLHQELKRVATMDQGVGNPVKLFPRHRAVHVDPQLGVTLDNGRLMEADVILGADGLFSTTRHAIKKMPLLPTGKAAFRFVMPKSMAETNPETAPLVDPSDTLTTWFGDDRRVVMYPCNDNEWLNFVCIHPDTESQTNLTAEWNKEASPDQVLRVFKDFGPGLKALITKANPSSIKVWQLMDMEKLPTWTSGKLALLGDAAHPYLPYQAQGGAQAFEDAVALAAVLPLGTPPKAVAKRLELYEAIRSDRAHKIQEHSRLAGQDLSNTKPAVDPWVFHEYNFNHDEIVNAAAKFKEWEAAERSAEQNSLS